MTSIIRTTLLLASLTGLMLLIGGLLGGRSGMLLALILSVAMNLGSYWYSDKIVLRMYKAREATAAESPVLHSMVRGLADRAGLPMPRIYIVDTAMPNAFATGRDPAHAAVAVTTGILKILNRDELEGVLAHELAHVKNRDTLISAMAATVAGVVTYMANIAQWGLIFGSRDDDSGNIIGVLATAILAPIAAMLIQLAISRGREFGADEGGARICGKPTSLASALAKLEGASRGVKADVNPATAHMFIVNPLSGKAMASLFSTHPSTEERIKRLMAMP
ncbi:MAG TPA: zinc metalloprotease HtpX [Methanotrichaceae archaeon]|nr:zinc metalloprotease HtpX [Methanotrichaceae archaeon]